MTKDKKDLLVFGYGLGLISAVFGIGGWIKHGLAWPVIVLLSCSIIFITVTTLDWKALKPGYHAWMKGAHLIGGVVTTLILTGTFVLIFIPIGVFLKLAGKDHLQRSFLKNATTYWEKRTQEEEPKERYHQQF